MYLLAHLDLPKEKRVLLLVRVQVLLLDLLARVLALLLVQLQLELLPLVRQLLVLSPVFPSRQRL
ncbi:hypothetical protein N9856_05185, partial [Porticoccaceae bacterium]|nr:hypothetical protein [Porticoccaceae bacterium]